MHILLLFPSWTGAYGGLVSYFARRSSTWPPLNLALLAAIAEQHGHRVTIIDGEAEGFSHEQLVETALSHQPDLIGLTATSPFFHLSKTVAALVKARAPHLPIAIGGPHITIMKEQAFLPVFDFAFVHEAEESWPQFLAHYESGKDLAEVKGLLFRRNGTVVTTGMPDTISDLDRFPFPARHLLPMARYKLGTLQGRKNFTSIQTMRGCPWKCIFCASEALKTTSMRVRSPQSVVQEMAEVVERFGITHFYIVDDVMTLWREHIVEICDRLDAANLSITFEGSTRANLVDEALIARLARSGLIRLSFGLESVNAQIRKTMKKQVPLEHYVRANAICNRYGIEALNSVMIGLPGETRETVRETLEFLGRSRDVKQANFAIAVPYPGTEFHEMALAGSHGVSLMTTDFSEYRRYGSAVTTVNGLTPDDLVDLQNEGFVKIYSAPWRWRPMLKKQGLLGGALTLARVARLALSKLARHRLCHRAPHFERSHRQDSGAFNLEERLIHDSARSSISDVPTPPASGSPEFIHIGSTKKAAHAGHYGSPNNPHFA
ncbi:MAG: radical SAM protein [Nitrospirae bacterium]|nr:MAG: radical SAM protein [Nitrospirota bacterium]